MDIKIFGQLTDLFPQEQISVDGVTDLKELKDNLLKSFPGLSEKTFVIAVNRKITHENIPLTAESEIALLPPFSGG
jgi:molybdopterin converting factor small subunit